MNEYFNKAFDLSGQVALVTGGGSGLGYAITKCLASAGATVVITGRREELLKQACDELGENVHYYVHDITDTDAAPEFIKKIVDTYGSCDFLINNAGRHCKKEVADITIQDFHNLMDDHLYGAFALCQAAIPYMREKKHGSIVFISSESAIIGLCLRLRQGRTARSDQVPCWRYLRRWYSCQRNHPRFYRYSDVPSGRRLRSPASAENSRPYSHELLRQARGHRLGGCVPLLQCRRLC